MIILDEGYKIELSLKTDASKPSESRPIFVCRMLSARDYGKFMSLLESTGSDVPPVKRVENLTGALSMIVTEAKNVMLEDLSTMLTVGECWELINAYLEKQSLSGDDSKKSG